jgi:hypothetical protein
LRPAILCLLALPLVGCPHFIYAVPTLLTPEPSFPGPEPVQAHASFVPVAVDLDTEGHFLVYRLRVDGKNLEPNAGTCRRWFLKRVAREGESAERRFCSDDSVHFRVAAGVPHDLELVVGSEHTVAKRVVLRPGANVRWRLPIRSARIELPIELAPGHAYTVEGREAALDPRRALAAEAPPPEAGRWDLDAYEPTFRSGVEVGSLRLRVLRDVDGQVLEEVSVPLYSGRMGCEPPFCP